MDDYESMDSFFRGFMVDQRGEANEDTNSAKDRNSASVSKKELFSGTKPGTNGLRNPVNGGGHGVDAGNDAVQGTGGV